MSVAFRRQVGTTVPGLSSIAGFSGTSAVETNVANTDTLIINTGATTTPHSTSTSFVTSTSTSSSTAATDSSSNVSDSSSSASKKSSSIPIGTVVGVCVGVFAVLCAVLFLVLWMGQRQRQRLKRTYAKGRSPISRTHNDMQNAERRKSGREVWVKMEDKDEGYEKYAMRRTSTAPSGAGSGVTVERSITVKSTKSSKTYKSGFGAGLGLADTFKTPEVPPRLEFTDSEMGMGRTIPPFARNEHESMASWDGETIAGGSFLSLKRGSEVESGEVYRSVGAMSPSMVVSHPTPPATSSDLHTWHEAEVVSPDGAYGGVEEHLNHPYASVPPSRTSQETVRKSTVKSKNPFLDPKSPFDDAFGISGKPPPASGGSAASEPSAYSQSSTKTTRGTFAEQQDHLLQPRLTQRDNHAMQSLIAALNISPEDAHERVSAALQPTPRESMQSSVYTDADDSSLHSENFPLPPTDIEHHRS